MAMKSIEAHHKYSRVHLNKKKAFSDNFRIFLFIQPSQNDTHRQRRPISNISKSFCFQVTYSLPFISYFATAHILLHFILFFSYFFAYMLHVQCTRDDLRACYKSTPHTAHSHMKWKRTDNRGKGREMLIC